MDRDQSGSIAGNELANVAIGGVTIGIPTAIKLIRIFDVDKNGSIDFYEYAALHKFLLNMQSLFSMGDRNKNGRLTQQEIFSALTAGGFKLSMNSSAALYHKYNVSGFGVTMTEFLALIAHVALARTIMEQKDTAKRGQIQLNYEQLLEVTAQF
eukprot:TRINITY_DN93_c0_g1_i1.p1 TRINITY_DN93_c0_g1~~TRINITY_DN93_c0_g1_i1.p1  ORF type:complete len:154 (+),score=29.46 TRINITY_DN93_c0_g1_i1:155-616(+)